MAKAKRKHKQRHAYDTGKDDDVFMTRFLRACGMSLTRRYTEGEIKALESMTDEQRARMRFVKESVPEGVAIGYSGPSLLQTRIKDEDGEKVTQAVRVSTLPRSLWWVEDRRKCGLEAYQSLFDACTPGGAVSLQPRTSGGSMSADPYDDDAMIAWRRARNQISKAERNTIDQFLRADDDALVGTHQVFAINSGASKLAEYFGNKGVI